MSDYNKTETKWNTDNEKYSIVMEIEVGLEQAFLTFKTDDIYNLLRAYRRQTLPKFKSTEQTKINNSLNKLTETLTEYNKMKSDLLSKKFYLEAEELFLYISQLLKEEGVYYREGKNASHAVLERG